MTPEELDAIEARVSRATDGPWGINTEYGPAQLVNANGHLLCDWHNVSHAGNRAFIAHARTDVPALITELRKAWGELRRRELVS